MGISKRQRLTPVDVLAAIKAVDGAGSGLDSDTVDGFHANEIVTAAGQNVTNLTSYNGAANKIPMAGSNGKLNITWLPPGVGGVTPHIDPASKHWFIDTVDTGILAEGTNGNNGTNGTNGITPHIDQATKNWFIGDINTGILAQATQAWLTTANIGIVWLGETQPYSQTISIPGVKAGSIVEVSLRAGASLGQLQAYQSLNLQDGGQGEGSITLLAWGNKNTVEIPVNIIVRGDV